MSGSWGGSRYVQVRRAHRSSPAPRSRHESEDRPMLRMTHASWMAAFTALALSACADTPSRVVHPSSPSVDAVKFWEVTATTRWNERANVLLAQRQPANGQAAASRILTYLSRSEERRVG